jgi:uncharacterized membrane protein
VSTTRLEAFSDGVIAVAITLLILDLHVPDVSHGLGHALLRQWPSYAAYVTSFITIGIIWINHHAAIGRLREIDHGIMTINLLLLMSIVLLPFTTSLMSSYLKRSQGEHLAAAIYSASLLVMGILFLALNRYVLVARSRLLATEIPAQRRRRIVMRNVAGIGPYAVATALAPVSPYATLAICFAVAAYYALPLATSD